MTQEQKIKEFIEKYIDTNTHISEIEFKQAKQDLKSLIKSAVEEERDEIKLLDEYIKLLESEVSRVGGLSIVKPYLQANPTKVAKGEELRTKIKAIRDKT